jgi:4-azaleucine resistance transporter AzlC
LFDHCYWVAGTVLGALAGTLLPINYEGVDFALTALFVTIFVEQWLSTKNHWPAIIGVAVTALCLILFGTEIFLIPSMLIIAASLTLMRKTGKEASHD